MHILPGELEKARIPESFWQEERDRLKEILLPAITAAAQAGAQRAARLSLIPDAFEADKSNAAAAEWARQYTDELATILSVTSREVARKATDALATWIETKGATVGDLRAAIGDALSVNAARADMIAVTEITRAYAEGERVTYEATGVKKWRWNTNRDDLVCPICGPLNGRTAGIGAEFGRDAKGQPVTNPPAHPGCRCWVTPEAAIAKNLTVTNGA